MKKQAKGPKFRAKCDCRNHEQQVCDICQRWTGNEKDRRVREAGPAAVCRHCGKRIVQDTAGRGWRHGETGPYQCCSTYAEPKPITATLRRDRRNDAT